MTGFFFFSDFIQSSTCILPNLNVWILRFHDPLFSMNVASYRCHTPAVRTQEPVDSGTFLRDPAVSLLSEILPFVHFRD